MNPVNSPIDGRFDIEFKSSAKGPKQDVSVKAYTGFIGKILETFGFATFIGNQVDGTGVFVNNRSLGKQVLISQGVGEEAITDRIKDQAAAILLNTPLSSSLMVNEIVKKVQLSDLLTENELDLIWENKNLSAN